MRLTRVVHSTLGHLSSVHRGTAFEKRSLNLLQSTMSMSLARVGGRADGGVDLLGWWWLPEAGSLGRIGHPYSRARNFLREPLI